MAKSDSATTTAPVGAERRPWGVLASLAWFVLIYEIAWRVFDALVKASGLEALQTRSTAVNLILIVASWGVSFGILALAVGLTRIPLRDYLGWVRPRAGDIALGIVVIIGVTELLDLLMGNITSDIAEYRATVAAGTSPWWYVLKWWPAMVFAPVVEESFFRGFLWRGVQARFGNWAALLLTTLMFLLIHDNYWYSGGVLDWTSIASFVATGLVLGWLRWRSGGTTVPMFAHAALNMVVGVITVALSAVMP